MAKHKGTFTTQLDLGCCGEHDAVVSWAGYTSLRNEPDDFDEMELTGVTLDFAGTIIDVTHLLSDDVQDALKELAWDKFADCEEDAQAAEYDHWKNRRDEHAE